MTQVLALAMSAFSLWPMMQRRVRASEQAPIRILVVDYPRPISEAVIQVEKHFGWIVTYEDTRYVHPSDLVDVTEQVRRDGNTSKRVLGMRNGHIDLTCTPRPGTIESQVGEVLREILAYSVAVGNTGEFRIHRVPGGYHVVPVASKGKSGVMEPDPSPLDARVTLPYREEDGLEMISRLAHAITTSSGRTVTPGTMPMSGLARTRVTVGSQNERARDVLWRALQSISPRLSWQLLCAVGERGECALNIHPVPKT
jgi:hypothetical protein